MGRLRIDRLHGDPGCLWRDDGTLIAGRCHVARGVFGRGIGLLGTAVLARDEALWLDRCAGVHTFGMRTTISCAFLDLDRRVLHVVRRLAPWRMVGVRGARTVVECAPGVLDAVRPGDMLRLDAPLLRTEHTFCGGRGAKDSASAPFTGATGRGRPADPKGWDMAVAVGGPVPAVLVVEDDPPTRTFLTENLVADRFSPLVAGSGEEALELLSGARPDAAVVDVGLPGLSGLELVTAIRDAGAGAAWDPGMPIVLTSGEGGPLAAVRGIERGADDFIPKPFHYPELLARLGGALRRSRGALVHETLRVGALSIDRHSRRATVAGRVLTLSAKEFALLSMLARDPTRVHTKAELLRDVWGYRGAARTRTVDSHASRLRRKLAEQGAGNGWIANVWGVGYRLLAEEG